MINHRLLWTRQADSATFDLDLFQVADHLLRFPAYSADFVPSQEERTVVN
jgi:hypothetical protein